MAASTSSVSPKPSVTLPISRLAPALSPTRIRSLSTTSTKAKATRLPTLPATATTAKSSSPNGSPASPADILVLPPQRIRIRPQIHDRLVLLGRVQLAGLFLNHALDLAAGDEDGSHLHAELVRRLNA